MNYQSSFFGRILVFSTIFLGGLFLAGQASANDPNSVINGSPKQLIVGDTVDISVRVTSHDHELITLDKKYSLQIQNQKPGQECTTTDATLEGDGIIRGYCIATGDPGSMEIWVKAESQSSVEINGEWYSPNVYAKYNADFKDPKEYCTSGAVAPSSVVFLKQNDIGVKLEWLHSTQFIGKYEVLYGTKVGEYQHKRQAEDKYLMIDGLDPRATYFFAVQAVSACKWTAASSVQQYMPLTGEVRAVQAATVSTATPSASFIPKKKIELAESNVATVSSEAAELVSPVPSITPELAVVEPVEQPTLTRMHRLRQFVISFIQKLKFW